VGAEARAWYGPRRRLHLATVSGAPARSTGCCEAAIRMTAGAGQGNAPGERNVNRQDRTDAVNRDRVSAARCRRADTGPLVERERVGLCGRTAGAAVRALGPQRGGATSGPRALLQGVGQAPRSTATTMNIGMARATANPARQPHMVSRQLVLA
jgi:hypothetical protein